MKGILPTKNIIFLLAIITISLAGLSVQKGFADIPNIDSFLANDPDDGDTVYSDDDTFTLTFSLPINVTASASMSQGAIDGNFTMSGGATFGTTYLGQWSADRLTLVITVSNVAGATTPTIGATTISALGGSNLGHAGDGPTSSTLTGSPILGGDYGLFVALNSGGGSCSGDCEAPTLGVNNNERRLVENGFTYNGKPVNVERYFTPYPLITVDVGVQNLAEFKIYDNFGPSNIVHFDLAFGLANGQILSDSKVMIEWDKTFDGKESIKVIDPDNVLDNVKLITLDGKCRVDSQTDDCLIVQVYHTFRAPPEFNIVGTNVWDSYRNPWQNYYNHGIEVVGDSLNPPKQYDGVDNGKLVTLTQIDKNHAVDKNGNYWSFDKQWTKDFISKNKIVDPISSHGIDRNHAYFETYLKGQELVANHKIDQSLEVNKIPFKSLKETFSYYPNHLSRAEDGKLQETMQSESLRAKQLFEYLYVKKSHPAFYP